MAFNCLGQVSCTVQIAWFTPWSHLQDYGPCVHCSQVFVSTLGEAREKSVQPQCKAIIRFNFRFRFWAVEDKPVRELGSKQLNHRMPSNDRCKTALLLLRRTGGQFVFSVSSLATDSRSYPKWASVLKLVNRDFIGRTVLSFISELSQTGTHRQC